MIKVGTDIISIERIKKTENRFKEKFREKFLLKEEKASKIESLAGLWASKEAISKALGVGIGKELSFLDIYISKTSKGAPKFELLNEAKSKFNIKESSLSISHDGGFAIAVVVIIL